MKIASLLCGFLAIAFSVPSVPAIADGDAAIDLSVVQVAGFRLSITDAGEARLAYEARADTADEALRLMSLMTLDHRPVSVEYSVREPPEPVVPKEPQPADLHGLTKPIYTISETASLLGTSRHSVYELVRRGLGFVQLGRRVLIPRSKIIDILNGEVSLDQQYLPAPMSPTTRRHDLRPKKSTLSEVTPPVQQPRPDTNGKSPARDRGLS